MNTSTAAEDRLANAWRILNNGVSRRAFPGAVAAISLRGELVALRAFGRSTYDSDSPVVTPDTIFDLASLTKPLAGGAMAMLLYDRGLLDLDTPVASIVPEFGASGARACVTVRHLLAHTSGLPGYEKLFLHAHSKAEIVAAACNVPPSGEPGERTEYSDVGFIILGEVLERVSGESIHSFCAREVFGRLGMSRTGYRPPSELRERIPPTEDDRWFRHRIVQGEVQDENTCVMGGVSAHAGLFAPAADVVRFAECVLRGGDGIFRQQTVRMFASPQAVRTGYARGLAWDRVSQPSQSGRYFSSSSFGHLGYSGTSVWIDPERELVVVLLTNRTWPDRQSQAIKQVRPAFHDAIIEGLELA